MFKNIYKKAFVFSVILIFFATSISSASNTIIFNSKISSNSNKIYYKNPNLYTNYINNYLSENKIIQIYSSNFDYNIGQSVQQTNDNGFIVTGFIQQFDFWNPSTPVIQNTILFKNNINGNKEWKRTFNLMEGNAGYSVQQTVDNGYIIGGSAVSEDKSYALLLKTDEQGNEDWKKTFSGLGDSIAYSVRQTNDNGFVLTGSSTNPYNENITNLLLLKTDEEGNLEWNKTFYFDNISMGQSVKQTEDMGYIVAGYSGRFEFIPGSQSIDLEVIVIKTDINGNEEWRNKYEVMDIGIGYSIQRTSDDGYIIGGTAVDLTTFTSNALLLKIDENGNEIWRKTYIDTYGNSVVQTNDNGYIIGGSATSSSNSYAMLLKTDENGNKLWKKTYRGLGISLGTSVKQINDGGYILTGATSGSIYSYSVYTLLLKTDEQGNLIWSKSSIRNISKTHFNNNILRLFQSLFFKNMVARISIFKNLFL